MQNYHDILCNKNNHVNIYPIILTHVQESLVSQRSKDHKHLTPGNGYPENRVSIDGFSMLNVKHQIWL